MMRNNCIARNRWKYVTRLCLSLFYSMIFLHSHIAYCDDEPLDSITHRFRQQLLLFPQEKVFVHTDRCNYNAGDTIWLRAHLVDAATHHAINVSRYVYVELIDEKSNLVNRIKLRPEKHVYHGYIPLFETLPQGYYTLRAYTRLMESMPKDFFFHTTIAIKNIMGKNAEERQEMTYSHLFDVGFYPEGGYLPAGVPWRVAFKGANYEGWSDEVYGQIEDKENGDTVAVFTHQHRGMGTFLMKAEAGKQYVAKVFNSQNRYQEFDLPTAVEGASVVATYWIKKKLAVTISTPKAKGLRLVMHSRGLIFYNEPWNPEQSTLIIDKKQMPNGIIQVLLINEQNQVLSERLVFNRSGEELNTELICERDSFGFREQVEMETALQVQTTDSIDIGDFSVSVCLNKDAKATSPENIYTYLLLTSELKGKIELPETYFKHNNKETEQNLDLLMMTQGWRRYNIPQVTLGEYSYPRTKPEIGQEIEGMVVSEFNKKPRPNASVLMIITGIRFFEEKKSDSLGRFKFTHLEFPENSKYIVRGLSKTGRSHDIEVRIKQESFPAIPKITSVYNLMNRSNVQKELGIQALNDSTIRMVLLDEINVTANKKKKETLVYNTASSTTYTTDFIEKKCAFDMRELLNSIPQVSLSGRELKVRGATSLGTNMGMEQMEVGLVVNGMTRMLEQVLQMDVNDIQSVTVIRNAAGTQWNNVGVGSLIVIETKPGRSGQSKFEKVNIAGYVPLGYQTPVEFYKPKYFVKETTGRDLRRTLHWEPCVKVNNTGKASFIFYTGDKSGVYTVLVQGVTVDGNIIYAKKQFLVKGK